jgi:D-alanine-D-alanine ligase-like ATP-grasp enzyme
MVRISRNTSNPPHLAIQPHYPFVTKILTELLLSGELPDVQEIDIEPNYGHAGRIVYANGSVRMFKGANVGINTYGATEIARDKGYTKYFLNLLGYSTPAGKVFLLADYVKFIDKNLSRHGFNNYSGIEDIYSYITSAIGYPCFIKPNSSTGGRGVSKCYDKSDVEHAISKYQKSAVSEYQRNDVNALLVEKAIEWPDYRVVIMREEVIACYLRRSLHVVGDGTSTIRKLLLKKQASFFRDGRNILINIDDARITKKLARSNYNLETVLRLGEICQVHDISNLSAGGEAEDYTDRICQCWRDLCVGLTKDMGLVLCGIDIACADLEKADTAYSILEINAAPHLDNYASSGKTQHNRVRELYKKVFEKNMQT